MEAELIQHLKRSILILLLWLVPAVTYTGFELYKTIAEELKVKTHRVIVFKINTDDRGAKRIDNPR